MNEKLELPVIGDRSPADRLLHRLFVGLGALQSPVLYQDHFERIARPIVEAFLRSLSPTAPLAALDSGHDFAFPDYKGATEPDGWPQIPSGSVWQQGERGSLYLVQWCGELHAEDRDWLIMAYNFDSRWHHPTESAPFMPCSITTGQIHFNQAELADEMKRRELRRVDVDFIPVKTERD